MTTIYHYDPETKRYKGSTIAVLSPADLKEGQEVPLVPANASLVAIPESIPEGQEPEWNGTGWDIADVEPGATISITTTKKLHEAEFKKQVWQAESIVASITCDIAFDSTSSKELTFEGISDVQANIDTLQAVIDAHDFATSQMDAIRIERNGRLIEVDYITLRQWAQEKMVALGEGITPKFDDTALLPWLQYQQALRDFPSSCDPNDPVWPNKPS